MAIVSTGLGSISDSNSLLAQRFVMPLNAYGLLLWYDVISEEPLEYVGKKYDDTAEIRISVPDGPSAVIARETVNSSDWQPIEGIDLPGGDKTVYHTGWKNRVFVVDDAYQGKTVVLEVNCWDVGDSAFDTAIIVDKVELRTR